jgi:hypothetical protein
VPEDSMNTAHLLKRLEENKEEMRIQNSYLDKMQKKIKELIGTEFNMISNKKIENKTGFNNNQNNYPVITSNSERNKINVQPMTGLNNQNLKNSRKLTIKSKKYYDADIGGIKNSIPLNEVYK